MCLLNSQFNIIFKATFTLFLNRKFSKTYSLNHSDHNLFRSLNRPTNTNKQ